MTSSDALGRIRQRADRLHTPARGYTSRMRRGRVDRFATFSKVMTAASCVSYVASLIAFSHIGVDDWNLLLLALLLFALGTIAALAGGVLAGRVLPYTRSAVPLFIIVWNAVVLCSSLYHFRQSLKYGPGPAPRTIPASDLPSDALNRSELGNG